MMWFKKIEIKKTVERKIPKVVFCLILFSCVFRILYWSYLETIPMEEFPILSPDFFVDTTGCKIPDYNPFSTSIKKFFKYREKYGCLVKDAYTSQEGITLRISAKLKSFTEFSHCEYRGIERESNSEHKVIFTESIKFTDDVNVTHGQIKVTCFDENGNDIYRNYHAFILPKTERIKELDKQLVQHKAQNRPSELLNVWMIGIESMSRLNHIRNMPKTRDLLLNKLGAFDFKGYTKVADNSFINIVPILTGHFDQEEFERLNITQSTKTPADDLNIIWRNYSQAGYSTLYGEDFPESGTFQYTMGGFQKLPTDYYLRPFAIALNDDPYVWNSFHNCVQNRSETSIILQYGLDFFQTFRHRPAFAFSFPVHLTHGEAIKYAYTADDYYFEILEKALHNGIFNNTVLIFFGDHGYRFGDFVKTFIGKLEERMPMMYVTVPKWFHQKYPQIVNNLSHNTKRLTSNFDIYETLNDILYFTGNPKGSIDVTKQRGISLFEKIPGERTCDNAGILPHWCVCKLEEDGLSKNSEFRDRSVQFFVNEVNNRLENYKMCSRVQLSKIKDFKIFKSTSKSPDNVSALSNGSNMYIIKISVLLNPGSGEFDTTLVYNARSETFDTPGAISRMNKYGHTADCVKGEKIQPLCYCEY
ncbi:uncharacterized protein LOC126815085 [Patella vulgata]|uniref:uncharacterized protein LOC126815085 n=1 Tax=Patella vulgata TaxID=6465 RepID=UPI00217FFE25|nr:uncharacterized protein LOC126815085 [Patella vulgata]